MNVLVVNCGSSSLKYQLIDSDSEAVLAKGLCERIGIDGRLVYQKTGLDKEITEAAMPTHKVFKVRFFVQNEKQVDRILTFFFNKSQTFTFAKKICVW